VTLGQSATLDATSSSDPDGTIATYEWDLDGDGTYETTGSKPTFTPAAAGAHHVTLRVTDDSGTTATATATVTVLAPPVARAQVTTAGPHAGSAVSFSGAGSTDADGTIARLRWDFTGDGVADRTSTTPTTTWTWSAAGTYPVTLTVTDSSGLQSSTTLTVTVAP
jgi:PKD repeat protein